MIAIQKSETPDLVTPLIMCTCRARRFWCCDCRATEAEIEFITRCFRGQDDTPFLIIRDQGAQRLRRELTQELPPEELELGNGKYAWGDFATWLDSEVRGMRILSETGRLIFRLPSRFDLLAYKALLLLVRK